MGVDYSAVLVVGLRETDIIEVKEVVSEVPIYDRYTGERAGTEKKKELAYLINGNPIPGSAVPYFSPFSFLVEAGLDSTHYLYDTEEAFFGEILAMVGDGDTGWCAHITPSSDIENWLA